MAEEQNLEPGRSRRCEICRQRAMVVSWNPQTGQRIYLCRECKKDDDDFEQRIARKAK